MQAIVNKGGGMTSLLFVKTISFITLSLISIALSVYLFVQFSTHPIERVLFGALALAFEGSKLFSLVEAIREWKAKKKARATVKISVYLLLSFLSIIASYGFSLGALKRAELDVNTGNYATQKIAYERQIEVLDKQIDNLMNQQETLPEGWITASQRLSESINTLSDKKMDLYIGLTTLEPPSFDLASNAFVMIGESIGRTGNEVMFWLLILLSVLIEVCILFTAPGTYIEEVEARGPPDMPRSIVSSENFLKRVEEDMKRGVHETPPEDKPVNKDKITKLAHAVLAEEKPAQPVAIRPRRSHKPLLDKIERFKMFVHILFENSMNAHIKSIEDIEVTRDYLKAYAAAHKKADIVLRTGYEEQLKNELEIMWKWLTKTKGPTGYFLVEKRNNFWFPNYTAELVINLFVKEMQAKD